MRNIFGATDVGMVRATNQDVFKAEVLSDALAFAILCDGMGGEKGGNVASQITSDYAYEALKRELSAGLSETSLRSVLFSVVAGANALVHEAAGKDEDLSHMGTTIILAVFLRATLYIACVGDSRAYIVSQTRELQLTRDHTVVQMLVDIGEITPEDAKVHPKRHLITRAIGAEPSVDADFIVQDLSPDDIVLLCSDGLYNYLEPGTFYDILKRCADEKSTSTLIDIAKERGGADNITAVVCSN